LKCDYVRYQRHNETPNVEQVDEQEEALIEHLLNLDKIERRRNIND